MCRVDSFQAYNVICWNTIFLRLSEFEVDSYFRIMMIGLCPYIQHVLYFPSIKNQEKAKQFKEKMILKKEKALVLAKVLTLCTIAATIKI